MTLNEESAEVKNPAANNLTDQNKQDAKRAEEERLRKEAEPCGLQDSFSWKDLKED